MLWPLIMWLVAHQARLSWSISLLPFFWHVPFHTQVFLVYVCLGSFFFFFLNSIPSSSSLVLVPELHLLPSWKYNLVGCPMHSCENAFLLFEIFPPGYFFFLLSLQKEDSTFKNKKNSYCYSDFQGIWWAREMAQNLNRKSNEAKNMVTY